jgi:transcription initiation factor IIE alpha subunit
MGNDIKDEVNSILKEQKELKDRLSKIQDECRHKNKKISFVECKEIMWVCEICGSKLNYPTSEEKKNWLESNT